MNVPKYITSELLKRIHPLVGDPPFARASGLLLAVSGGIDSMAMLDVFLRLAGRHGLPLRAAHVHHGTGSFADRSQALVRRYCQTAGVPLLEGRFQWDGNHNFEYQASRFRARFFAEVRRRDELVLLAHHQDDQVETFFQTLVRGAGVATPLGMAFSHEHVVRPFLNVSRRCIADHALIAEVPHLLDPTNHDYDNFRNRVRHQIAPQFEAAHGRFGERLGGWLADYAQLRGGLEAHAQELFEAHYRDGLSREVFRAAPTYLHSFILRCLWRRLGIENPKREQLQQIMGWIEQGSCGLLDFAGGRFYCDLDALVLTPRHSTAECRRMPGEPVVWADWRFVIEVTERGLHRNSAFAEAWNGGSVLLREADGIPKSYKELMRRAKVPLRIRKTLPRLVVGGATYHFVAFLRMEADGDLTIQELAGPPVKSYFEDNNSLTSWRSGDRTW